MLGKRLTSAGILLGSLLLTGSMGCKERLAVLSGIPEASTGAPEIFALDKLKASPGDVIKVAGRNLEPGMFVLIGDSMISLLVESRSSASFVMPNTGAEEEISASILSKEKETIATLALLSSSTTSALPVMEVDPSLICSDIVYRDPSGKMKSGLRNCSSQLEECSADVLTNCIARESFPAVNKETIESQKTRLPKDLTIGGVTGSLSDCSADGETGCLVKGPSFAAAMTLGAGAKIVAGSTLAGVEGTTLASPGLCTSGNSVGCVSVSDFPSIDKSLLTSSNIKSGTTINGVVGSHGRVCTSDGDDDCLVTGDFKAADTSEYDTWDIRAGKSIGGISGQLRFFKSGANLTYFNRTVGTASDGSPTAPDFYDTVSDKFGTDVTPSPWVLAGTTSWLRDAASDTDEDGTCAGVSEDCVYLDRMTKIYWLARDGVDRDWETSIDYCETSTAGGYNDWRLATSKELSQAQINGIWNVSELAANANVHSATSRSLTTIWVHSMGEDYITFADKTVALKALCVRP